MYKILSLLTKNKKTKTKTKTKQKKNEFLKTIFGKALTPFYKTFLYLKQLCSGKVSIFRLQSTTCNKVKIASNMADWTNLKHSVSSFKAPNQ